MSPRRDDPRGQLDIPLVWELDSAPRRASLPDDPFPGPAPRPAAPVRLGRLALAALADLGVVLLGLALAWLAAVAAGAEGEPRQLALIFAAGLEATAVGAVGALWGWRGTPGMLLLRVGFETPLPPGAALRVWLAWCLVSPLAGLPLLAGRAGGRVLERLAGTALSSRLSPVDA